MALTCSNAPVAWRLDNATVLAGDVKKRFACFQKGHTSPSDGLGYSNTVKARTCDLHPMLLFLGLCVYDLHPMLLFLGLCVYDLHPMLLFLGLCVYDLHPMLLFLGLCVYELLVRRLTVFADQLNQ